MPPLGRDGLGVAPAPASLTTRSDGYVTWVNNGKQAWTIRGAAMAANTAAEVSGRPVSEEPMYMIINLGLSENFGAIE
jgi:hypothetical protein